jgi:hypothetical protein
MNEEKPSSMVVNILRKEHELTPPLDIEEALDLILACTANTSRQEGQRHFSDMFSQEFFVKLRQEQEDPRARAYLIHLLPLIGSAIRAFAVERQIFETRWEALKAGHQERLKFVDGWVGYSPLNQSGVLYRIAGPGALSAIFGVTFKMLGAANSAWFLAIFGGAALGYLATDLSLKAWRHRVVQKLYAELPSEIDTQWQESLIKYRKILEDFLLLAIKVRERFYPELPPAIAGQNGGLYKTYAIPHVQFETGTQQEVELPDSVKEAIRKIVERHFSFK